MIIQGTEKIRGVVDLYSIRKQLSKGAKFSIKDSDFWNTDVQTALRMGLIVASSEVSSGALPQQNNSAEIVCKNLLRRPISVLDRKMQISPGQEFKLTQAELENSDIQHAIAKKMIGIVRTENTSADAAPESTVTVSSIIEKEEQKLRTKERVEKFQQREQSTRNIDLDTNEEISVPNVIDNDTPAPAKAKDIRKTTTIWNPTKAPMIGSTNLTKMASNQENVVNDANPPAVNPNDGDPRRTPPVVVEQNNEVTFVDQKQEEERFQAHPKLKDKELPKPNDPELLNPDEERRKQHPKLKNKKSGDGEIDFVDLT